MHSARGCRGGPWIKVTVRSPRPQALEGERGGREPLVRMCQRRGPRCQGCGSCRGARGALTLPHRAGSGLQLSVASQGCLSSRRPRAPKSRLPRSLRQYPRGGLFLLCPCPEAFAPRPCVLAAFTDWLSPPHAPSPGPSLLLVARNANAACPTRDIHQGRAPWGARRGPGGCPSVLVHGHLFFVCSLGRQRPQPQSVDSCPSTRPLDGVLAVGTWWAVTHCQRCWRPLLGLRWCFLPPTAA